VDDIFEYKDFKATQNTTGDDRGLHITGTIRFRRGKWEGRIERDTRPPIGISPLSPKFRIVVKGGGSTAAIHDVDVAYNEEHHSHVYVEVLFSEVTNEDGSPIDDEPPPRLRVEHPDDPDWPSGR